MFRRMTDAGPDMHVSPSPLHAVPVAVVGRGSLATVVARVLADAGAATLFAVAETEIALAERVREAAANMAAVVACSDAPSNLATILLDTYDSSAALIACELTEHGARLQILTPRPARGGCPACHSSWRASRDPIEAAARDYLASAACVNVPWRYRHSDSDLSIAATFVSAAIGTAIGAVRTGHSADHRVCVIDFAARSVRAHDIARHYACPRCQRRVAMTAEALRDDARRRWDAGWETPGAPRDLIEIEAMLRPLIDPYAGVFDSCWTSGGFDRRAIGAFLHERGVAAGATPFLDATRAVVTRSLVRSGLKEQAATEGFDFREPRLAEALALVEGVERLCAFEVSDRSRIVRAAHAAVDEAAIDPRMLPLFTDEQYREPGFPFRRFDPDEDVDWLWGMRIASGSPVLVPADLLYGRAPATMVQATTNGASCHSSLHQAVLNGLYEVVERDALMVAWLNRSSLPRLTPTAADADPYGVRAAFAQMSFDLTYVDLTNELGIPVVLGVLEDQQDRNFFLCTMVASLSTSRLMAKLHRELSQFAFPHLVDRTHYRSPLSGSDDASGVRTLPDHLRFYQDASKRPLTAFLTASRATSALRVEEGRGSIEDELRQVIRRLTAGGYEPIAVDCTLPFVREMGLWAVKVVVPGLQPLHAGHNRAPLASKRLTARPNPWPHPFW